MTPSKRLWLLVCLTAGVSLVSLEAAGGDLPHSLVAGFVVASVFALLGLLQAVPQRASAHVAQPRFAPAVCAVALAYGVAAGIYGLLAQCAHLPALATLLGVSFAIGIAYAYALEASTRVADASRGAVDLRFLALGVATYSILLRLIYAGQVELLPEETYYWNYSQHLDLSYLDHPPMVAWLIWLGTHVAGNTEFGVRLGAMCCGLASSWFAFRLTRNLFGERAAWVALILVQSLPFFFLSGFLMTPDSPLTAAWFGFLLFAERAVIGGSARAWWGVGLCLGLGLISKYTIALAAAAVFLYVLLDASARPWLRKAPPYLAVVLAGLLFLPVLVWNAEHEWASFLFQTSRRLADRHQFALHKLLLAALILITPVGAYAVVRQWIYHRSVRAAGAADALTLSRWRLLLCCLCVPLGVFALFSLRHEVKMDWTGAPLSAAVPIIAIAALNRRQSNVGPRTVLIVLSLFAVGFAYLTLGLPGLGYSKNMELAPVGWRELGRQVESIAKDAAQQDPASATQGGGVLVVGMDRYETASQLAFYREPAGAAVASTSSAHLFGGMGLMYEFWFPPAEVHARRLVLVAWKEGDLADARLAPYFDHLGTVSRGDLRRDGRFIRSYYYRIADGYRPREH